VRRIPLSTYLIRALVCVAFACVCAGGVWSAQPDAARAEAAPELDAQPSEAETDSFLDKLYAAGMDPQIAAEVGTARVTFGQVFEVWGPTWRRVIRECHLGDLEGPEADRRLQAAWEEALETTIREEVFYQEARRTIDKVIEEHARAAYNSQDRRRPEARDTFTQIERKLRARIEEQITRAVRDVTDRHIRRAGGAKAAHRILRRQGLTWEEWKARLQRKVYVQYFLDRRLSLEEKAEPRPDDIRAYYRNHPDEFTRPGRVVFRHILIGFEEAGGEGAARRLAAEVYDRIRTGALSFAQAAKQHSDDEVSAPHGGREPLPLAEVPPEALASTRLAWLDEVRDAAQDLPVGELGPPLVSNHGCHIVRVEDKEAGERIPFRVAQEKIAEIFRAQAREEAAQALYRDLLTEVRVDVRMPEYPQRYAWSAVRAHLGGARTGRETAPPSPEYRPDAGP